MNLLIASSYVLTLVLGGFGGYRWGLYVQTKAQGLLTQARSIEAKASAVVQTVKDEVK